MKVLAKIWSVALKYHFRMPPYYTLLLRSLASFEGMLSHVDLLFSQFLRVPISCDAHDIETKGILLLMHMLHEVE